MIEHLLWGLKWIDAPGSTPFLCILIGLGLFIMFVWPRHRRVGRWWLMGVLVLYLTLALPATANVLAAGLGPPPTPVSLVPAVDTLVVFDGDNRTGRVRTMVDIFRVRQPAAVWVLG